MKSEEGLLLHSGDLRNKKHLTCTVAVCTRDRPELLDRCLAAVFAGKRIADEVLVVDSAPARAPSGKIAAKWGARYVLESRKGLSRARNRAAREAVSDLLAFVDDDTIPEPEWLAPLTSEFDDDAVALATGRVLPPEADMDLLSANVSFGFIDPGAERRAYDRSFPGWYEQVNFAGIGVGANMVIRRSVFDTWRGFDERLGAGSFIYGGEELKAFFELIDRGHRIVYAPGSVVRHAFPRAEREIRKRTIRSIESSAAYLMLLIHEVPLHRRETQSYMRKKLGRPATMYRRETTAGAAPIPGWRVLWARLTGAGMYFVMRLAGKR